MMPTTQLLLYNRYSLAFSSCFVSVGSKTIRESCQRDGKLKGCISKNVNKLN